MNAQPATPHLTEDQIDDVLLGEITPQARLHLADCPACSAQVAQFTSAVGVFNQASLAWAEAKVNTLPRTPAPHTSRWGALQAWSAAAVTVLALALGVGLTTHRPTDPAAMPELAQSATVSPGELARDNEMLSAIDSAIAPPADSPLAAYGPDIPHTHEPTSQVKN